MAVGSTVISDAHAAITLVGGAAMTVDTTPLQGLILSADDPVPDAGMDEGYTDERPTLEIAILVADFTGPPLGGMEVTIDDRPGIVYAIDAGIVGSGPGVDWRFTITEAT